jgi:imidazolonepropionase-like amidohydrolase
MEAQGESHMIVLTNANVLDGVSSQAILQATVVIREGKIVSVGARQPVPAGATVVDLQGRWLAPGLIDAHVHFADVAAARIALRSGVTTVRTGGVARFLDIGIRELNRAGLADLPDVVAAGYQVNRQPPETFFLDFPGMTDLMQGVRGPDNVRRLVRALAGRGVNVIKVLATERGGLPQTDPRRQVFNDEELSAIVDEAKRAGLPVMAHAHGDEGAAAAVRAGVRTIEHGTYLSDQTLALMKERGTCLVPTITTITRENGDPIVAARARANVPIRRALVARALEAGVRVITGTDIEYADKYGLQDEIAEFARQGMTWNAALKSATADAAACLGIDGRTGSVKPGLEADLIGVDRSPVDDVDALRDPVLVVNNGKVAVNRIYR